jgi:prepilin-type N-terminal cleavage/methylation domain-containing protein
LKKRLQAGFTLLEVLIATTVLGTAVVALLGLHARNIRLAAEIGDATVAGMLASQVVAATRIAGFPELGETKGEFSAKRDTDSFHASFDRLTIRPYGTVNADRFRWRRSVQATALEGLRQVQVSIVAAGSEHRLAEMWFAVRFR